MTDRLVQKVNADPHFAGAFTLFRANTPPLYVDIDRTKVEAMHIPIGDVFTTLQVEMGGLYVNQFNRFGRTWWVAAGPPRASAPRPPRSSKCRCAKARARWSPWARWPAFTTPPAHSW